MSIQYEPRALTTIDDAVHNALLMAKNLDEKVTLVFNSFAALIDVESDPKVIIDQYFRFANRPVKVECQKTCEYLRREVLQAYWKGHENGRMYERELRRWWLRPWTWWRKRD